MQTFPLTLTWIAGEPRPAGLATPSPSMTVNPDAVTPGFVGFVAIAVIAVVVVFLLIDMLRRIRRAGYRADINEQLDAEAEADAQADTEAAGVTPPRDAPVASDTNPAASGVQPSDAEDENPRP